MACCICPEGECPPDCHFLEVFPLEAPFKTEQQIYDTGIEFEFIKKCLLKAKTPDEQKRIVEDMIITKARSDLVKFVYAGGNLWEAAGVSRTTMMKAVLDGTLTQYLGVNSDADAAVTDGTYPPKDGYILLEV